MERSEQKAEISQKEKKELDREVMLFINRRLYQSGLITEETYRKANDEFLKI
jgi:hypothetical protein